MSNNELLQQAEWIDRARKHYMDRAKINAEMAHECAKVAYEVWVEGGSDPEESPEDCADADMECWDE